MWSPKCVYLLAIFVIIGADWVEIPQFSNQKSYLGVTPYDPYIYEQSSFFTTTPSTYETAIEPDIINNGYSEMKKSITKFPDHIIKNIDLTTEMTITKTLSRPQITTFPTPLEQYVTTVKNSKHRNNNKHNNKNKNDVHRINSNKNNANKINSNENNSNKNNTNKNNSNKQQSNHSNKNHLNKNHPNNNINSNKNNLNKNNLNKNNLHKNNNKHVDLNNGNLNKKSGNKNRNQNKKNNDDKNLNFNNKKLKNKMDVDNSNQINGTNYKNKDATTSFPVPKISQIMMDEQMYDEEEYGDEEEYAERDLEDDVEEGEEYYDDEYEDDEEEEPVKEKGGGGGYTYAGFIPYLQNIQSTLIRNSHKTTKSKVSFLTEIRDRLIYAIREKISSIWSTRSNNGREKRSTRRGDSYSASWEKGESSMEFPSNEGALLTIGFLTFAVFLIKCILKLIRAIKGKDKGHHGGVIVLPIIQLNTTTSSTGRRKRSYEEDISLLNLIDSYKYQDAD